MELGISIVVAEGEIEEQKAVHAENVVTQTVLERVHTIVDELKSYVAQTQRDDQRIDDLIFDEQLDENECVDVQENDDVQVCADLGTRLDCLEDIENLVNKVGLREESMSLIDQLFETDRVFNDTFFAGLTEQFDQQLLDVANDREDLSTQLQNQQQVFDGEREKLERELVQTFSLIDAQTIDELELQVDNLKDEQAQLQVQLGQDISEDEAADIELQLVDIGTHIEHHERLVWLADTVVRNQACADTLSLMQELRPAGPIFLDGDGLPVQQFGPHDVGPAFATEEAARAEAQCEYERRCEREPKPGFPHVLHVMIKDEDQNTVNDWWEVSERDADRLLPILSGWF